MSCDNMPENGHVMRNVTCAYARAVDAELADWIEANVTFPSTMVDRIVPAVTADTLDKIEQLTGVRDPAVAAVNRSVSGLSKITLWQVARNGKKPGPSWCQT
jgi:fructuronate reductase